MGVTVAFDYTAWITRYPEFNPTGGDTPVSSDLATLYFNEATGYWANNGSGPVGDSGVQSSLLNMLTAHIAFLNAVKNGKVRRPVVGNITAANEGSVGITVQNNYPPGTPQWYQQTEYGSSFYALTAQYRTMRYRVARQCA